MKRTKNKTKQTKKVAPKKNQTKGNVLIAAVLGIIVFILNYIYFSENTLYLNKFLVLLASLFLGGIVFYSTYNRNKRLANIVSKYTFLAILLYNILLSFILIDKTKILSYFYQQLIDIQNVLFVPAIVLGIISIYINKNKLNLIIEELFNGKTVDNENKTRKLKPLKNFFSSKERLISLAFFIVLGISIFTLFYRLDYFDLYSDESQVTQGAAGYYYTGEFKKWDFVKDKIVDKPYKRAFPHLFLIAQSYKVFGITPWSGRFVSAFFGIILITIGFFISFYFTKNRKTSLFTIFSFAFYFEFLLLFRWTRMYAILMPLYLLVFYVGYKFINEKARIISLKNNKFIVRYLGFNYRLLLPFVFLLVLNYYLHLNSLIILPFIFVFSLIALIWFKEKKHFTIIILGIIFFIIGINMPNFNRHLAHFSFFNIDNSEIYSNLFAGYPFSFSVNIIVLIIGLFILFISKNREFQKKTLYIYLSTILSFILFSYVLNYAVSFRYISFVSPIVIILILGMFFLIIKVLYKSAIRLIMGILVVVSVVIHINNRFDDLYERNFLSPAYPSIAFKDIIKNYKKGELVYRHWSPLFYLDKLDTTATVRLIGGYKGRPFHEVIDTIQNYPGGWLTWHTHFRFNVDSLVRLYAETNFIKYHGHGVDTTGVELYYYNNKMLRDTSMFKYEMLFPLGNLNLENPYSISFWSALSGKTNQEMFTIQSSDNKLFSVETDSLNLLFKYNSKKDYIKTNVIKDNNLHHFVWYQTGGNINDKFGVFVDGKKLYEKSLTEHTGSFAKFKINKKFTEYINDIQIYDLPLDQEQVKDIILNKDNLNFTKIFVNGEEHIPLYRWTKK